MPTLSRARKGVREKGENALLDAAEAMVAEGRPFGELAVGAIAARAGFSRATFYAYFEDKRALVLRLADRMTADLEQAALDWLGGASSLPARDVLAVVNEVFRRHRGTVAAIVEAATYDASVAAMWRGLHDRFRERAEERIASSDPALPAEAVTARAFMLVWATERALTEHLAAPADVDEGALLDALALAWESALGRRS